ncbi:hypothetical protein FOMPIDRAFT_1115201 [Fomitopsis schrenkii]|uniref:REM-1 domain-containing protein n=1 Tax=Fomitopsis schrenkii TaxID=2126942 RepID=S8EHR9_FOMSC|nr:hypothetical protein FOMPIDRAFT_1115201 [Fomitopsis schrenkii]
MEYRPKYAQPFTLQEAAAMDVPVLTEEIARLQNSLQHLRRTQHELQIATDTDYDPEIAKALEENNEVIGSQEERISILKMALAEKGVLMSSHYDLGQPSQLAHDGDSAGASQLARTVTDSSVQSTSPQPVEEAEDGVFL